jgi:NTP pyrophosphatase (non-canonical NTP hydrolase)
VETIGDSMNESNRYAGNLNSIASDVQKMNDRWWQDPSTGLWKERNVGEMLMLSTSELAEAMEGHRKNLMDDKLPQYKSFDVEVVDCMIRLLDIARLFKNPIQEIYESKMEYNRTREDHTHTYRLSEHGKKY